jgi:hypothetical protein
LANIDEAIKPLTAQQNELAKYKTVSTSIKTFMSGLTATSTLFDSLVWAQDTLFDLGGTPVGLEPPKLRDKARLTFALNVQDATVTKSSTFRSNQIKGISSVEAYYAVVDNTGLKASGVFALTMDTPAFSFGNTPRPSYHTVLPPPPK